MDNFRRKYKELEMMKHEIEEMQKEYKREYKNMLEEFLKANGFFNNYVKVNDVVGILKTEEEPAIAAPYTIKFYPLKNDGSPSFKSANIFCFINNDFDEIKANVKAVKLKFVD